MLSQEDALAQATREYDEIVGGGGSDQTGGGGAGGGATKGPLHDKYKVK